MIERINGAGKPVVAVDVPSGVVASTGEVPGAAVRATDDGHLRCRRRSGSRSRRGGSTPGSVHVASIGLEQAGHEHALLDADGARDRSAQEARSTKYRAGSVLVVGGSRGLTGAPMLAALAAFRADAGYVTVAAPESSLPVLESRLLEAVKRAASRGRCGTAAPPVRPTRCSSWPSAPTRSCSGPGLGRSDGTRDLVRIAARAAPGAGRPRRRRPLGARAVRALGADRDDAARGRARAAARDRGRRDRRAPARVGAAGGVEVRRDGAAEGRRHARGLARERACSSPATGRPSLATAGTGDVLSGVIGAFLAKGMEPRLAAGAGAVAARARLAARLPAGRSRRELICCPALQRALEGEGSRPRAARLAVARPDAGPRRANRPGASACSQRRAGTSGGRRSRGGRARSRSMIRSTTRSSGTHDDPVGEPPEPAALREPGRVDEAGADRVHRARRAAASSTATERENASWACLEAEYGPTATSPATETTLTRCEPAPSPGRKARSVQTEPR